MNSATGITVFLSHIASICLSAYPPSFYLYFDNENAHWEIIEGLESKHKVEECIFRTIFGKFQGYKIYASRKVAEKIEIQTHHQAEL